MRVHSLTFPVKKRSTLKRLINNSENRSFYYEWKEVHRPDHSSSNPIDQIFYRAYNCRFPRYGLVFNFDKYFARECFTHEDMLPSSEFTRWAIRKLDKDREIYEERIESHIRTVLLCRLENKALDEICNDTLEALSYFYYVGKKKKKVIFVSAHGDTDPQSGLWRLHASRRKRIFVNEIVNKLSYRYNPRSTGAIVLDACNEDGMPVEMKWHGIKTRIPVLAPTSANAPGLCSAKVYWPFKS